MSKRLVWDLPTRIAHWLLALGVVVSWVTAELDGGMDAHLWIGYATATLLLFRLAWGVVGTRHARFASFIRGPGTVLRYLRAMRAGNAAIAVGHNPVGGISIVLMLLALIAQVGLGFFASDDYFYAGPYNSLLSEDMSDFVTGLHDTNYKLIVALAIVHIGAVLWYRIGKRHDLITPMITGYKPAGQVPAQQGIEQSALLRAAIVLAVAALTVWALVALAPAPPAALDF